MKNICFLLGLLTLWSCASQHRGDAEMEVSSRIVREDVRSRIDSTLKAFVDEGRVAGASALIFEKGDEVYYNAFGYSDREAKVPMDRNTIVRIFSMTKPVTGVALMQLYEKGAFALDDPIEKYAPEFANLRVCTGVDASGALILEPPRRPLTIRDITRHTSGFVSGQAIPELQKLMQEAQPMNTGNTLSQMAEKLGRLPLMFHPGTKWSYGLSVDVQAFLVERLSGMPFDQYVRENIFGPLRMKETRYVVPEGDRSRFAALYQREDGKLARVSDEGRNEFNLKEFPLKPGGWGLTSTLDDYMRFARMLVNEGTLEDHTVLREETVKLMTTNHLSDSVTERMFLPSKGQVGFGIDFAVRLRPPANGEENQGVVGEFFWDGAASTLFWVDPVNKLTAVLFVQLMPFDREIHKRFRDAVYGPYVPESDAAAMLK